MPFEQQYSDAQHNKSKALWQDGHSQVAIAKIVGVPVSCVYGWSRRWRRECADWIPKASAIDGFLRRRA